MVLDLPHIGKKISRSVLLLLGPVLTSLLIYILFRDEQTIINKSLSTLIDLQPAKFFVQRNIVDPTAIPNWVTYSLPGGLWVFSFTNLISHYTPKMKELITYTLPLFILVITIEVFQFLNWTDGTFDRTDLFCYTLFYVASILLYGIRKNKEEKVGLKKMTAISLLSFFSALIYFSDVWV